jgi:glycosyltransferase involved in cell wall biosynthesis
MMNMNPFFSIVIPYYNGQDTIKRCVDSVYRQGLQKDDFEIIVVDDNSPQADAWDYLLQLSKDGYYSFNLNPIRLSNNLRQGGARNRGVKKAKGDYIVFVDQDDWLSDGALSKVKDQLISNQDVLMVDFDQCFGTDLRYTSNYSSNSDSILSGEEFICSNKIPWAPWCYVYNRKFLLDNKLTFAESVRWEDADFVMSVTLSARKMSYSPIHCVVYYMHDKQTSDILNDVEKICDYVYMSWRLRMVSERFHSISPNGAKVVMGHHYFMYKSNIRRYLWRIPTKEILRVIKAYPAESHATDWLTQLSINHPKIFAYTLSAFRPILNALWRIKQILK